MSKVPQVLVIGYGSIGRRHSENFKNHGCDVSIVSRHHNGSQVWQSLADLEGQLKNYDIIMICNETTGHLTTCLELIEARYQGVVVVEKPIFQNSCALPEHSFRALTVAYNLRFHPILCDLKAMLADQRVIAVTCYVGQYLPHWRPGTDYRACYSARKSAGGGVLRDLSHELDYLGWLFGRAERVSALGGHISGLDIDSEDCFSLIYQSALCPHINLQMNYLDRIAQRYLTVHTEDHSYKVDFLQPSLCIDGEISSYKIPGNFTYEAMVEAILAEDFHKLCSYDEAVQTLELIEAAESSNRDKQWYCLKQTDAQLVSKNALDLNP